MFEASPSILVTTAMVEIRERKRVEMGKRTRMRTNLAFCLTSVDHTTSVIKMTRSTSVRTPAGGTAVAVTVVGTETAIATVVVMIPTAVVTTTRQREMTPPALHVVVEMMRMTTSVGAAIATTVRGMVTVIVTVTTSLRAWR
jgi:hypothetical protein